MQDVGQCKTFPCMFVQSKQNIKVGLGVDLKQATIAGHSLVGRLKVTIRGGGGN